MKKEDDKKVDEEIESKVMMTVNCFVVKLKETQFRINDTFMVYNVQVIMINQ